MLPQQMQYRKARETDCPELVRVQHAAVHALASSHYAAEVLDAWSPAPDGARQGWLADLLARDAVLCTVAETPEGRLAGFCIAEPARALLRAIYVHPDFAGKGIGRALLERTQDECRALGVTALWLNASYNAEAFYSRCGYGVVGPVLFPLPGEASMGAVRMVKRLDAGA